LRLIPRKTQMAGVPDPAALHPTLQDQHGCHAVYRLAPLIDGKIGLAQQSIRFGRREAFIPEMNREAEFLPQVPGKGLCLIRLNALRTTHAQGQANDDLADLVFPYEGKEILQVVALVPAVEGLESLGRDAKRVRDRNADSMGAQIQRQDATWKASLPILGRFHAQFFIGPCHCPIIPAAAK